MSTTRRERRLNNLQYSLSTQLDEYGQFSVKCSPLFRRELRKMLKSIERVSRRIVAKDHRKYSGGGPRGPRRKGSLMRSIHAQPIKDLPGGRRISGTVTAGSRIAPYARYVHEGTEPHPIQAKKANALSFDWKYRRGRIVTYETHTFNGIEDAKTHMRKSNNRKATLSSYRKEDGMWGYRTTKARWGVGDIRGRSVVVPYVDHPGQDGNPFLNRAAAVMVAKYGGRVMIPPGRRRRAISSRGILR